MRKAAAHRKQLAWSDCFATYMHVAAFFLCGDSSKRLSACCHSLYVQTPVVLLGSHYDTQLHCHLKRLHMSAAYRFIDVRIVIAGHVLHALLLAKQDN